MLRVFPVVVTDEDCAHFRIAIPCHDVAGNIIADIAHKDASVKVLRRGAPESALQNLGHIQNNSQITMSEIANVSGCSRSWVVILQEQNIVKRVDSTKTVVVEGY